jgi:hypothetical protein
MTFSSKISAGLLALLLGFSSFSAAADQSARITFRRVFPASTPEFIEITIREDSDAATYEIRQIEEDSETAPNYSRFLKDWRASRNTLSSSPAA